MYKMNLKNININFAKNLVSLLAFASLVFFSACDEYNLKNDDATIKAIDGYIKDATVTDTAGRHAKYSGEKGEYIFEKSPLYPIKLTGGRLEDTNQAFDIEMSAKSGLVISPITTFINADNELRQKLTNNGFLYIKDLKGFSVDYIATGNADLAKLSQLFYVMLRDEKVTKAFKKNLKNSDDTKYKNMDKLFEMANKTMEDSKNFDNIKDMSKKLLNDVKDYNGTADDIENHIEDTKKKLSKLTGNGGGTGGGTGTGGGAGGNNTPRIVTVIDGYIKNATVVDSLKQKATYSSRGKYTFKNAPTHPITVVGGKLEATNEPFDIQMSVNDGVSSAISPITTFINGEDSIRGKLSNVGFKDINNDNINNIEGFSVDYMATGNLELARLAQHLYIVLKDNTLTTKLKNDINGVSTLPDFYTKVVDLFNNLSAIKQLRYKAFMDSVKAYTGTAANIESDSKIKAYKYNLNHGENVDNITHNGVSYGTVMSPVTGKIWLDRNLGASKVCDKARRFLSDDGSYTTNQEACFGDYYQWGRETDGHEKANAIESDTQASSMTGAGNTFIKDGNDWLDDAVDKNGAKRVAYWAKTDGSSVCPIGYRVSTQTELEAETKVLTNRATIFNSFLKLPVNGYHKGDGGFTQKGNYGSIWVGDSTTVILFDKDRITNVTFWPRSNGYPIRCLKIN